MRKMTENTEKTLSKCPSFYREFAFQNFTVEGRDYYIAVRVHDTDKKPALFVRAVDPNHFVSSLYPAGDRAFNFDLQDKATDTRTRYRMTMVDGVIQVLTQRGRAA